MCRVNMFYSSTVGGSALNMYIRINYKKKYAFTNGCQNEFKSKINTDKQYSDKNNKRNLWY